MRLIGGDLEPEALPIHLDHARGRQAPALRRLLDRRAPLRRAGSRR